MSQRRLRHGGSRLNRGTPYGGFMGYSEQRGEHRWRNVMPEAWVTVGVTVIHRKTGHIASIASVVTVGPNTRHMGVAVYYDTRQTTTSGPFSMRAFYLKWQRACEGCGKAMDGNCAACQGKLVAEQMDVYRGIIGPIDPPVVNDDMDPYVRDGAACGTGLTEWDVVVKLRLR